ncbi:MAG: hypothetical protein H7A21_09030 [Spirochaetales bacterium]|nr:hypothetical protein [Leptospiraceae bacterium]MCP5481562.1 hypothetical protein [Spirochaetales bacterium]MCP5484390.1 hypothetical protein [Spirochaetales bacterium]
MAPTLRPVFFVLKVIPALYLGLVPFLGAMFPAHNERCPCHGSDALVRLRLRQLSDLAGWKAGKAAPPAILTKESPYEQP